MRPALIILALAALSACDSSGRDPEPYAGVVEVSLARTADGGAAALLLVAVDDTGCAFPLAVETDASPSRLDVRVVGIVPPEGGACDGIIPARATVRLPFTAQGEFPITVAHAGSNDAYTYSIGFAGERLVAVRTSTTRLAAP